IPGGVDGIDAFYWDQIIKAYGLDYANFVTADGGAEDFNNLLGGHIDAAFVVPSVGNDYIETGEIKPLVVLSDEASEDYPDVPTLKDIGLDVSYTRTYGL